MKNTKKSKDITIIGTISTARKGMGFVKNPQDVEKDILIEAGYIHGS